MMFKNRLTNDVTTLKHYAALVTEAVRITAAPSPTAQEP